MPVIFTQILFINLGVWSGDVIIENVELNPEILQNFDFPMEIIHSSVGRLKISVPWTSLSSKPVEILLQDVFLIVTPTDLDQYEISIQRLAKQKLNIMTAYAKSLLAKFAQEKKEKGGYMDDIGAKILDNI